MKEHRIHRTQILLPVKLIIIVSILILLTKPMSSQVLHTLKSVTHIDLPIDTVYLIEEYNYNNSWRLDSVVYYNQSGTKTIKNYRNDTLINEITPTEMFEYVYNSDSIIKINVTNSEIDRIYFTDSENREVECNKYENGNLVISYYYIWENENSVLFTNSMGDSMIFNYYSDILNPRYQYSTPIRFGIDGTNGSYNYISELIVPGLNITEQFIVDELEMIYPLVVTRYTLGSPTFKYVFEYYIIGNIAENVVGEEIIESIKYFNIIGQEIQKPKKGLYIERIQSNKGIVSNKYFIK